MYLKKYKKFLKGNSTLTPNSLNFGFIVFRTAVGTICMNQWQTHCGESPNFSKRFIKLSKTFHLLIFNHLRLLPLVFKCSNPELIFDSFIFVILMILEIGEEPSPFFNSLTFDCVRLAWMYNSYSNRALSCWFQMPRQRTNASSPRKLLWRQQKRNSIKKKKVSQCFQWNLWNSHCCQFRMCKFTTYL